MTSITVSSSLGPGHVVVVLRGELDVTNAVRFARALSVAATSGLRVIVDLAGLAFMDCGGLSALISAFRQARRAGGDLVLAAPKRLVVRLLFLTDVTGLLPVYISMEEAANGSGRAPAPAGPEQADGEVDSADGEADAPGVAVQLELLLRLDRPLEPFGPVGQSVPSTMMAI